MKEYGTLEPLQEEKPTSRKSVLIVVGVLACVAVLGFATGSHKVFSVVDTNRNRAQTNPVDADVHKAFQEVCDKNKCGMNDANGKDVKPLRFAISGLKKAAHTCEGGKPCEPLYSLVPMVSYGATDDWVNDWKTFKTFMPSTEPAVGFGVYNFPVWTNKMKQEFSIYSVFVSFQKKETPYADLASKYLGGSFLGSALLAASGALPTVVPKPSWVTLPSSIKEGHKRPCAISSIKIDGDTTYVDACKMVLTKTPGDDGKLFTSDQIKDMCAAETVTECPFGTAKGSPCVGNVCKKVEDWMGDDQYPAACCTKITKEWCKTAKQGCGKYKMAIYTRNCDPKFGSSPTGQVNLLEGLKDESPKCTVDCKSGCAFMARKDTYKNCAGCATDHKMHKYEGGNLFRAKCHSEASGFQGMRCCGLDANCDTSNEKETCKVKTTKAMEAKNQKCTWLTHRKCGALLTKLTAPAPAPAPAPGPAPAPAKGGA